MKTKKTNEKKLYFINLKIHCKILPFNVFVVDTSSILLVSTTLGTWMTKMVENFVKSYYSPNLKVPTFLPKKVASLPLL
jgi:hypothetical protein